MAKTIKSSLQRFDKLNSPLGKKQPSGAMNKRQAESVNLSAKRLIKHKDGFRLGGIVGQYSNRGSEICSDNGVERLRFYCKQCGTMVKDNENNCRICYLSFGQNIKEFNFDELSENEKFLELERVRLSSDKFDLQCKKCRLPFYIKVKKDIKIIDTFKAKKGIKSGLRVSYYEINSNATKLKIQKNGIELDREKIERSIIADRIDENEESICLCWQNAKSEYTKKLRFEREKIKLAKLAKINKLKARKLSSLEVELIQVKKDYENSFTRKERKELSRKKAQILEQIAQNK